MTKNVTAKQQKAIDHFIVDRDKTKAYRHAYSTKNMKMRTVNRRAVELFKLPYVKEIVDAAIDKASENAHIDAAWVLKRSAMLANFNINKFIVIKDGVPLYDFSLADDDDWYCINEIAIDQIGVSKDGLYLVDKVKLKGVDKLKALEQVGKNIGVQAFRDQIALGGSHDMPPIQTSSLTKEQALELLKKHNVK